MKEERSVLVVDDSDNDRFLLRRCFKNAGFDCPLQEVGNGEEAIAYLQGEGPYGERSCFPVPSVVLLDLNMPRKNGFDVLEWMRTQPDLRGVSVFILSASARPQDVKRAHALGANAFLVKPPTVKELTDMVRSLHDWLQHDHFPPETDGARGASESFVPGGKR
jgi:CheY-like chemotaxis protein